MQTPPKGTYGQMDPLLGGVPDQHRLWYISRPEEQSPLYDRCASLYCSVRNRAPDNPKTCTAADPDTASQRHPEIPRTPSLRRPSAHLRDNKHVSDVSQGCAHPLVWAPRSYLRTRSPAYPVTGISRNIFAIACTTPAYTHISANQFRIPVGYRC